MSNELQLVSIKTTYRYKQAEWYVGGKVLESYPFYYFLCVAPCLCCESVTVYHVLDAYLLGMR